ncbi:MAG: TonB-dependent receptor plug domain-containing protein, partial [Pseudomonadota bacterium]
MKSTRAHALQALLAVLCGPLSSPASVAQSDSASDVLPMEEIEITARRIGGAREVTEAVTSVTADALDDMALPVVTDALRGQTGVYVQQTTPGQGTAIVRGLKGSEVLHLVDGMRLNNALFRNAPNQYLALVDPFIAQRVDVVRGPLSTIYGSDAMGGAVQVVTDRPFLGGGDLRTAGRGVVRFDGRTLGRVAHASMWVGQGDWGGGGAISLQDHDNVRAADRRAQAPSGYRSEAASGFVSWRPSDNQRTELSFQWLNQPSTPRFDELNAGFGQSAPASEVFRFEPNARTFVHFEHDVKGLSRWLDDAWLHVGWQRISDGRRTRDTGAATTREEDNRSDLFGVTFNAAAAPFGIHDLQYGLDLYYDTVSSVRTEVDVNTGQRENIRARFPDGSTLSTADLYVHDDMTLSDDWLLTTGLRL